MTTLTPEQIQAVEHVLGNKLTVLGLGLDSIRHCRAVDRNFLDGMIEAADTVSETLSQLRASLGRRA